MENTGATADIRPIDPETGLPRSTTIVTDESLGFGKSSKCTPQIYRQCWAILRQSIESGGLIRTKAGLLYAMDSIEKQVKG